MVVICTYFLIGVILSWLIHAGMVALKIDVNHWEALAMITLWPLVLLMILFYFFQGLIQD